MDNNVVIEGEAPETDSDEDIPLDSDVTPTRMNRSVQGAIIAGEASESEDEHGSSVSSAVSALTHPHIRSSAVKTVQPENEEERFNTLLHKKLKECNRSLHNNLQIFTHNVINEATRDLTSTDQQLLKSQVTLQAAVTSLRSLNHNASALKQKLDIVISSQFFPNVRLSHSNK